MPPRYFAIVPAAGHSARMGQAKLLLPLAGQPLIGHTISAWRHSSVNRIVVVIRPNDEPLAAYIRTFAGSAEKIDLVLPEVAPPDMKASVQTALRHIERQHAPAPGDAFLVAPADMPRLSAAMIGRLIEQHAAHASTAILAPSLHGRRGHPVLFPWQLAAEVFALADDQGLDALVHRRPPQLIPCDDLLAAGDQPFTDVDTPEDFDQLTTDG